MAALVLAARSRKELLALTTMFLAGQIASVLAMPDTGWRPAARFVEAAAAAAEMIAIAIFALVFSRLKWVARALHPVEVSASALLVFGMVWFVLRLRN
ncbi:MAG: hypothetical protein ABSG26_19530 [Bryobacteraceae bacterium]